MLIGRGRSGERSPLTTTGKRLTMPKTRQSHRSPRVMALVPTTTRRAGALTPREQEILSLIWAGFRTKEIGAQLKISPKTVEAHRASLMKKLRVSNTANLLRTAIHDGLLKIG